MQVLIANPFAGEKGQPQWFEATSVVIEALEDLAARGDGARARYEAQAQIVKGAVEALFESTDESGF